MSKPILRFTPYAWAKLIWFRDRGKTEIGGFGITTEEDPLFVYDIAIPKQEVSSAYVEFDDAAVSDHFEDMFDFGIQPINCGRIWIHTHPVGLAQPSGTDRKTFKRVFGNCDWAVMFILPKGGGHYCELNFNTPIAHSIELAYKVDYNCEFDGSDVADWEKIYEEKIKEKVYIQKSKDKKEDLSLSEYFRKYCKEDKAKNPYFSSFLDNVEKKKNSEKKGLFTFEEDDIYFEEESNWKYDSQEEEELFQFSAPKQNKKTMKENKKGKTNGKKTKTKR